MSDQHPTHVTTVVSDPASHIDMHDDVAMDTIQTSLVVLKEGSSLAAKLPYIAPITGLLFQALHHAGCTSYTHMSSDNVLMMMYKLATIAKIIVNVNELCKNHNLSEEDLPASLRAILGSLQRTRELDRIERVLKKCSKRKGLKGILLRKDLLTRIKQCDVELSNVLQAFHAELSLDTRVAIIATRREEELNVTQTFWGTKALDALWRITLNAKGRMHHPGRAILGPDLLSNIMHSPAQHTFF
ncbi:hypothetical protein EDB89DRAFT_2130491 [Lactarius sanguifluus]|nr:hypothetical protein EDB89DRAFT_2130491 [Lactarius sanguifluus]